MLWIGKNLFRRADFDNSPLVYHCNTITDRAQNRDVMANDDISQIEFSTQFTEQLKHRGLNRHIQARGWLVENNNLRRECKDASQPNATLLAAAHFMGIAIE